MIIEILRFTVPSILWSFGLILGSVLCWFHPNATHPGWFFAGIFCTIPIALPATIICVYYNHFLAIKERNLRIKQQEQREALRELENTVAYMAKYNPSSAL